MHGVLSYAIEVFGVPAESTLVGEAVGNVSNV